MNQKLFLSVASSISAVIGTDIKGVCNYMQKEVQAKLVAFEHGRFMGDYSIGLTEFINCWSIIFLVKNRERERKYLISLARQWAVIVPRRMYGNCRT